MAVGQRPVGPCSSSSSPSSERSSYTIARPNDAGDYGYEPGVTYASSTPNSTAAELTRLNELRTEGAISDAEFEDLKARTIAAS